MRAAVFTDYGEPLDVREVDDPEPAPHGAVVGVEACGVCRSDWHAWQGDWGWRGLDPVPGHILGHEPAGHVLAVGCSSSTLTFSNSTSPHSSASSSRMGSCVLQGPHQSA